MNSPAASELAVLGPRKDAVSRWLSATLLSAGNEKWLWDIIEALPAAIYTTDAEGRVTHYNSAAVAFSGRTPEIGSDQWCVTFKLFHPDGRPMPHHECPMAMALKEGRAVRGVEAIAERPDGTRVWFEPYPTPLFDQNGRLVGGVNMLVDITERKKADASLRESEERLQLATEGAGAGVWDHNLVSMKFVWSERHRAIFGIGADARATFDLWRGCVHPDDLDAALAEFARARNERTSFRATYRIRTADTGEERWIEDAGRFYYAANGAPIRCAGVVLDVTARKQDDIAARRLAAIVESSDDAIVSKDLNGVITSWNKGAERIFGYTAQEAVGMSVTALIPPDRRDEEPGILARIRNGEVVGHYETVRQRKDRRLIDVSLTVSPVRDASGTIVGASKVARDITEKKEAESRRKLLLDELNHRVKNTLATVQSIALLTMRKEDSAADALAAFNARLVSLSAAHNILTATQWEGADLDALVASALTPYADARKRFSVTGPRLRLRPKAALAMSLALHELATNASKYGALSTAQGLVEIAWEAGDATFRFSWSESGGPEVVAPKRRGFGSRLIEEGLGRDLGGGEVDLVFAQAGLACRIVAPLAEITGKNNPAPAPGAA